VDRGGVERLSWGVLVRVVAVAALWQLLRERLDATLSGGAR
jgi:hypothetical protein